MLHFFTLIFIVSIKVIEKSVAKWSENRKWAKLKSRVLVFTRETDLDNKLLEPIP
jgi:hypothetical protein